MNPSQTDPAGAQEPPGGGSSSLLYLYTFLVTLILLCSVSAVIITRSYYTRRRFRRQVEEALRNGQVLSPNGPGLFALSSSETSKLFGSPPKLWDVWIQPLPTLAPTASSTSMPISMSLDHRSGSGRSGKENDESPGKFPWIELKPLALELILPTFRPKSRPIQKSNFSRPTSLASPEADAGATSRRIRGSETASSSFSSFHISKLWGKRRIISQLDSLSTSALTRPSAPSTPVRVVPAADKDPRLRVVTLISMPTPHRVGSASSKAESESSSSGSKGKAREERLDLNPIAVGLTEVKISLDDEEEEEGEEKKDDETK